MEGITSDSDASHATEQKLCRDRLVAASDAIRNDPAEQAELRRIMAEMDQYEGRRP